MYNRKIKDPMATLNQERPKWVVIANRTQARIFIDATATEPLRLLRTIKNPDGKLLDREVKEGRPGRSFSSWQGSHSRHTMSTEVAPHEQIERDFCRLIGEELSSARKHRLYDELFLVAEPRFMGVLQASMDVVTRRLIKDKLNKDLSRLTESEINRYFHREPKRAARR